MSASLIRDTVRTPIRSGRILDTSARNSSKWSTFGSDRTWLIRSSGSRAPRASRMAWKSRTFSITVSNRAPTRIVS